MTKKITPKLTWEEAISPEIQASQRHHSTPNLIAEILEISRNLVMIFHVSRLNNGEFNRLYIKVCGQNNAKVGDFIYESRSLDEVKAFAERYRLNLISGAYSVVPPRND